jgi:GMP synthase C terminal domain
MTADLYPFAPKLRGQVPTRIINEVKGIKRVVYEFDEQAAWHDRVGVADYSGCIAMKSIE